MVELLRGVGWTLLAWRAALLALVSGVSGFSMELRGGRHIMVRVVWSSIGGTKE